MEIQNLKEDKNEAERKNQLLITEFKDDIRKIKAEYEIKIKCLNEENIRLKGENNKLRFEAMKQDIRMKNHANTVKENERLQELNKMLKLTRDRSMKNHANTAERCFHTFTFLMCRAS